MYRECYESFLVSPRTSPPIGGGRSLGHCIFQFRFQLQQKRFQAELAENQQAIGDFLLLNPLFVADKDLINLDIIKNIILNLKKSFQNLLNNGLQE